MGTRTNSIALTNDSRRCSALPKTAVLLLQVRCSRLLYTLCVEDNDKADKLKQSLPPGERLLPISCPLVSRCSPG